MTDVNQDWQTATLQCANCERPFQARSYSQLRNARLGKSKSSFCTDECRRLYLIATSVRAVRGPCPTCGKMFNSRNPKKYCSLECWTSNKEYWDLAAERNRARGKALIKERGLCIHCQQRISPDRKVSTKYCSKQCRRLHFVERFDRWIANPQSLSLPQCYDEFFAQDELPCLIAGCEWSGRHLAAHVNAAHGITADQFRELAGFNRSTGLVTIDISRKLSEAVIARDGAKWLIESSPKSPPNMHGVVRRQEAAEHLRKSIVIRAEEHLNLSSRKFRDCKQCGTPVEQPAFGKRYYCNNTCRTEYYRRNNKAELLCQFCGKSFLASEQQVRSARRGNRVFCSIECRNSVNLVAALASRGIQYAPSVKNE